MAKIFHLLSDIIIRAYFVQSFTFPKLVRPTSFWPCIIENIPEGWTHVVLCYGVFVFHAGNKTWIPRHYCWNLSCVQCVDTRPMDSRKSAQVAINAYILNGRNRECRKPMCGIMSWACCSDTQDSVLSWQPIHICVWGVCRRRMIWCKTQVGRAGRMRESSPNINSVVVVWNEAVGRCI